jgi:amino acid transporter
VVALTWLSVVAALFAAASFGNLTVINTLLYGGSLALEFVALVVFRLRRPDAPRPFRVPWGWMGIGYVCAGPLIVAVFLAIAIAKEAGSFATQLVIVAAVVAGGAALYFSRRRFAR